MEQRSMTFAFVGLFCAQLALSGCAGSDTSLSETGGKRTIQRASVGVNLAATSAANAALSQGRVQATRSAIEMTKNGRLGDALSIADNIQDDAASATIQWAAFRNAPRQVGFDRLSLFLDRYPEWPSQGWVKRRAEESLWRENRSHETVQSFFARHGEPLTDEGRVALASARLAAGDRAGAAQLIQLAYLDDKLDAETEDTIVSRFSSLMSRDLHRKRAQVLVLTENPNAAQRAAARAGGDYVTLVKAANGIMNKSASQSALSSVSSSLRSDPLYSFAAAQAARRAEKLDEAVRYMREAPRSADELVAPNEWWVERRVLSRALLRTGDFKNAYQVAADHKGGTDQTEMEADFQAGWIALRFLKDPRTAASHFAEISRRAQTPISTARGAYWQGRAADASGDTGAARGHYERASRFSTTYYGQLARNKLGMNTLALRTSSDPSSSDRSQFESRLGVRAIKAYGAMDEDALAAPLLIDYANKLTSPQELALLSDLARREGSFKAEVNVGKAAIQRGIPLEDMAYPISGMPQYQRTATSVERPMALAIARQESLFDPKAKSHAGAIGLMQMLPSTASRTASRAGIPFSAAKLYDGQYNATLGSAHLGELMEEFNGSYIMTFAAYNAGSHRVREWVQTFGDPRDPSVDAVDWVEAIPFSETRNYVQRVMENYQVYRTLSGQLAMNIERDLRAGSPSSVASVQPQNVAD